MVDKGVKCRLSANNGARQSGDGQSPLRSTCKIGATPAVRNASCGEQRIGFGSQNDGKYFERSHFNEVSQKKSQEVSTETFDQENLA